MQTTQQVLAAFGGSLSLVSDKLTLMASRTIAPSSAEILAIAQDLEIAALYLKMVADDGTEVSE